MFTQQYFRILSNQLKLAQSLGAIPLLWDINKGKVKISKKSKIKFYIFFFMFTIGIEYLGLRVAYIDFWGQDYPNRKSDVGLIMAVFQCGLFHWCFATAFLIPENLAMMTNAIVDFGMTFTRNWKPGFKAGTNKTNLMVDKVVRSCVLIGIAGSSWTGLHFFLFPTSPLYPFSILPASFLNLGSYMIWGVCFIWIIQSVSSTLTTLALILCTYGIVAFNVMKNELTAENKQGYSTLALLRSRPHLLRVYREFEILHKYVNSTFEYIIVPAQFIATEVTISCNFLLMTSGSRMDGSAFSIMLFWSICGVCIWSTFLVTGSFINVQGKIILDSWKFLRWTKPGMKYMKKFKRGCRPLGIRVGGYYSVKKLTLLKYWQSVIRGTFKALLALK